MRSSIKLTTRVLPGGRIEFAAPELREGQDVEVYVALPENRIPEPVEDRDTQGVWDYIRSLTPVQRTPEEWAELDREFQEERNSWDF